MQSEEINGCMNATIIRRLDVLWLTGILANEIRNTTKDGKMLAGTPHTKGTLGVMAASLIWGTTGTAASQIPDVSPLATGAFAMGVGGVLLLIQARRALCHDAGKLITHWKIGLTGGLSVAMYPLAFYSAMSLAGIAIGTVISIASAPCFSMMLEHVINRKPIAGQWWLSLMLGALGITLLMLSRSAPTALSATHPSFSLGIGLGFVAGLTYATYSWSARQLIHHDISAHAAMASQFGLAAMVLLPLLWFYPPHLLSSLSHLTILMYMAVIPMFGGYLCFSYGLKYIQASQATLITLLEPVIATLLAIFFVGETLSPLGWAGMLAISLCILSQILPAPVIQRIVHTRRHVKSQI